MNIQMVDLYNQYLKIKQEIDFEMQEVIKSGLKLHAQKKATLVETLKASGRCKFSDEQLGKMDLDMLENLAALADVPSYEGIASPRQQQTAEDNSVPMAPRAFD